jgi:hypothetical protein
MNAVLFAGLRMMFPLLLHPGKNLYYGDYYYNKDLILLAKPL